MSLSVQKFIRGIIINNKVIAGIFLIGFWSQILYSQSDYKDTLFEIQGHQVYVSIPMDRRVATKNPMPVLMAIHGSGRNAMSYCPFGEDSNPFYVYQRDRAVQNGYLFVVVSNGKDTWGTDKGLELLIKLYANIIENFKVEKKWTLWATSAGGLQMYRMVREHPDKVEKVLGTFPAYDLMEVFEKRKGNNFVWKEEYEVSKINPALYPEDLVSIPMLIFHGKEDKVLPYQLHSLRLKEEVNALGGKVELVIVEGGHSTANWAMYETDMINCFLNKKR